MKFLLIFFSLTLPIFAEKSFEIKISGQNLEPLKKKAELDMVSSTNYCRGELIPHPISDWNCSGNECTRNYDCKKITKSYSRLTEIPKLKSQVKKTGKVEGEIQLPKPQKKLAIDAPKPQVKRVNILPTPEKKEESNILSEKKMDKFDEEALSLLDEQDFVPKEKLIPQKISQMDRDITYEELSEPKQTEKKSLFEKKEGDWKLIKTTSREGGFKSYELEKIVDKTERFKKKVRPLALAFGLLGMSGTDTNLSSFYAGWVPRWELAPRWAIRGEIGLQYFTQQYYDSQNVLISENNFIISPYALYLNFFGDFYFVEAGGGFQWWYNQENEFNPMLSLGLGYRIPDTFFALDRISLNYDYISSDVGLNEFKLSFTFIF